MPAQPRSSLRPPVRVDRRRVRFFLCFSALTWLAAAAYHAWTSPSRSAGLALAVAGSLLALLPSAVSRRNVQVRLTGHVAIALSLFGLTATSLWSAGSASLEVWLLPLVPLAAAGLLSIRASVGWAAAAVLATALVQVLGSRTVATTGFPPTESELFAGRLLLIGGMLGFGIMARRRLNRQMRALLRRGETIAAQATAVRSARDAALRASSLKDEFLNTVSHEVRTPMAGILGMTDLLLDTDLDPQQREFAESTRRSADRLFAILEDMLEISSIQRGVATAERADFELAPAIHAALAPGRERSAAKGLGFEVALAPGLPRFLRGEARRLTRALAAMVDNAVKFTEAGWVSVRVEAQPRIPSGLDLEIVVRDTGVGIPAERRAIVFEAFAQGDASATSTYEGSGLGLAVARAIADHLGGDITFETETGQGATFHLRVPVEPAWSEVARLPTGPTPPAMPEREARPHLHVVPDSQPRRQAGGRG